MGIYDRDYMRDERRRGSRSGANAWAGFGLQLLILLGGVLALYIVLRLPLPGVLKLLAGLGVLSGSIWGVVAAPRWSAANHHHRQGWICEARGDYGEAIEHYQKALGGNQRSSSLAVRLLAAYHGAGRTEDAKALLRYLDRARFNEVDVEEMEMLLVSLGGGRLEPLGNRWILLLD